MKRDSVKMCWFESHLYVFNKNIFRFGFVLLLLVFVFAGVKFGFGKNFYYGCPANSLGGVCQNPWFKDCNMNGFYTCADLNYLPDEYRFLSELEFVSAGYSVGVKPNKIFTGFYIIVFSVLLSCFGFNHLLYNRGFKLKYFFNHLKRVVNDEKLNP